MRLTPSQTSGPRPEALHRSLSMTLNLLVALLNLLVVLLNLLVVLLLAVLLDLLVVLLDLLVLGLLVVLLGLLLPRRSRRRPTRSTRPAASACWARWATPERVARNPASRLFRLAPTTICRRRPRPHAWKPRHRL